MLSRLTVSNLAVVERAQVDFCPGLNVLTGETGAGKSVLIGALELVMGARADSSIVRDGAANARVEAVFEFPEGGATAKAVEAVLDDAGIEHTGALTIRRLVAAGGGTGRVWINDCSATVGTLRRLAAILVDIHGPRANQSILEEAFQRGVLDSFGGISRASYAQAWEAYAALQDELDALLAAENPEDEIDLLSFQTEELAGAGISADDDTLGERHAAAAHAGEIVEAANDLTETIGGDGGMQDLAARIAARARPLARFFPDATAWAEQAEELGMLAGELSRSIADAASRIDADPAALEEMDARLGVVNRLARKYGASAPSQLLEILAAKRERLAALSGRGRRIEELRAAQDAALATLEQRGAALREARAKAGARLAKAVTAQLRDLGFAKARFAVAVAAAAPARSGCDKVEFVFEPNPGESARALSAIASSGEAATPMLALKSVLAAHDGTDLLVFDEIDANIGGETGRAVGGKMRAVAAHHQVVAITHLPQSAVFAERHFIVSKAVAGGRTRTSIHMAEGGERVAELARMLGGGPEAEKFALSSLAAAAEPDATGLQKSRRQNRSPEAES